MLAQARLSSSALWWCCRSISSAWQTVSSLWLDRTVDWSWRCPWIGTPARWCRSGQAYCVTHQYQKARCAQLRGGRVGRMVQCVAKRLETWVRLQHLLHESHEFGRSARKNRSLVWWVCKIHRWFGYYGQPLAPVNKHCRVSRSPFQSPLRQSSKLPPPFLKNRIIVQRISLIFKLMVRKDNIEFHWTVIGTKNFIMNAGV